MVPTVLVLVHPADSTASPKRSDGTIIRLLHQARGALLGPDGPSCRRLSHVHAALHQSGRSRSGLDWPSVHRQLRLGLPGRAKSMGAILTSSVLIVSGAATVLGLAIAMHVAGFAFGQLSTCGQLVFLVLPVGP